MSSAIFRFFFRPRSPLVNRAESQQFLARKQPLHAHFRPDVTFGTKLAYPLGTHAENPGGVVGRQWLVHHGHHPHNSNRRHARCKWKFPAAGRNTLRLGTDAPKCEPNTMRYPRQESSPTRARTRWGNVRRNAARDGSATGRNSAERQSCEGRDVARYLRRIGAGHGPRR